MKFKKRHLCELPHCYAVTDIEIDGKKKYVFATDDDGPCYCIDSETSEIETVWEGPGGTMSLIPLPGKNGAFLASQRFFPGFNAPDCEIVLLRYEDGKWTNEPWLKMPYVHRFDILERGGAYYLLCCTLAESKKDEQDWSKPGGLFVAELSPDFSAPAPTQLRMIANGMTRNHGYCRLEHADYTYALTACDEGVFEVVPPESRDGEWSVRRILDKMVSDIAVCDIDGDGLLELATIEPFHGSDFVVYHKTENGYEEIYRYPDKMAFVHVVWGGLLRGVPVFLGGCRAINKEMFVLSVKNGEFTDEIIESGMGPSNVKVISAEDRDLLLTANREAGECAVFEVTD